MESTGANADNTTEHVTTTRVARTGSGPRGGMVTREAVYEVAEALEAKLGRVTAALVRETLGGGSFTPIAAHLRAYREDKRRAATASPDELLTAPLREAFVVAFGNAQAEARKECAAELAAAEEERLEASASIEQLEAERARLQEQVDELQVVVNELREQSVRREAEHRERGRERDGVVAALTKDRDDARRLYQEQQTKVSTLEAEGKQAAAFAGMRENERRRAVEALESERRGRADADKARAVAEARAVAHQEASKRMERELERSREDLEKLRASVESLRDAQRTSEQTAHKLALENTALSAHLNAEKERAARRAERQALAAAETNRVRGSKQRKSKEVVQ